MADILIVKLAGKRFTWGGESLRVASETRDPNIVTFKAVDNDDFTSVFGFARS